MVRIIQVLEWDTWRTQNGAGWGREMAPNAKDRTMSLDTVLIQLAK